MSVGEDVNYNEFIKHLYTLGFETVNCGSFRTVFVRKRVVIKVPRNTDGINDNMVEAAAWHKYKSQPTSLGYTLAPCRLLPNKCLMMVTVDTSVDWGSLPAWCKKVDGSQVGNYHGHLVAYDYAVDIYERIQWEKEWGVQSVWFPNHIARIGLKNP